MTMMEMVSLIEIEGHFVDLKYLSVQRLLMVEVVDENVVESQVEVQDDSDVSFFVSAPFPYPCCVDQCNLVEWRHQGLHKL